MVRYRQRQAEQAYDRTDQPLSLSVGKAEHGAQGQRRQDRQHRIPRLPAPGGARLRRPRFDRLGGEPDRQAPALAEAGVVLAPVGSLMLLQRDMVATVLVQLGGYDGVSGGQERGRSPTPLSFPAPTSRSMHHATSRTTVRPLQAGQRTPSGQRCWRTKAKHLALSISAERLTRSGAAMMPRALVRDSSHPAPSHIITERPGHATRAWVHHPGSQQE